MEKLTKERPEKLPEPFMAEIVVNTKEVSSGEKKKVRAAFVYGVRCLENALSEFAKEVYAI